MVGFALYKHGPISSARKSYPISSALPGAIREVPVFDSVFSALPKGGGGIIQANNLWVYTYLNLYSLLRCSPKRLRRTGGQAINHIIAKTEIYIIRMRYL